MQRNLINGVLLGKKIGFGSFVKDDNRNKQFTISKNFNKRSFLVAYRLINLAKKEPRKEQHYTATHWQGTSVNLIGSMK